MWKMLDDLAVTDSAAYAEMAKAGAEALVRRITHRRKHFLDPLAT